MYNRNRQNKMSLEYIKHRLQLMKKLGRKNMCEMMNTPLSFPCTNCGMKFDTEPAICMARLVYERGVK